MINPSPVETGRSPYRVESSNRPPVSRTLTPPQAIPKTKKRRNLKRAAFFVLISLATTAGLYLYTTIRSFSQNISIAHQGASGSAALTYSDSKKIDASLFTQAGDGRFNVVVLGIGGDNHPGALLTDSMQVVSVDTVNKKISTTSIPRDLYVSIPGYARTKINNAYSVGEQKKEGDGGLLVRETIESVFGVKISNFVLIDFTGAKELIDTLGGIDVDVPKAIVDPFFPDDQTVGYAPFKVKAGIQHMDGKTALNYARSRETTSDFDRSARQQLIMQAMRKKALTLGVLANPVKLTNIVSAVGKHLKTDLSTEELRTLMSLYKDLDSNSNSGQVLDTSEKLGLLTATNDPTAGYISYPVLGFDKFSAVQRWFQMNNPDPLIKKEGATITVAGDGRATTKQLQEIVDTLTDYGYTASLNLNSQKKGNTKTQLYAKKPEQKPISRNYLGNFFQTQAQNATPLSSGSDFELIYVPPTK